MADLQRFYFHTMFQANIPVRVISQPDARGRVRIKLPSGAKRLVKASLISARPVQGYPIQDDI